jgi:hypothetical protein
VLSTRRWAAGLQGRRGSGRDGMRTWVRPRVAGSMPSLHSNSSTSPGDWRLEGPGSVHGRLTLTSFSYLSVTIRFNSVVIRAAWAHPWLAGRMAPKTRKRILMGNEAFAQSPAIGVGE